MASDNETVAEVVQEMRAMAFGEECCPDCGADFQRSNRWSEYAARIEEAHRRDREDARRMAERSVIYNMMESFPRDWDCNPDAVRKWMTARYKIADDLREGGEYAK